MWGIAVKSSLNGLGGNQGPNTLQYTRSDGALAPGHGGCRLTVMRYAIVVVVAAGARMHVSTTFNMASAMGADPVFLKVLAFGASALLLVECKKCVYTLRSATVLCAVLLYVALSFGSLVDAVDRCPPQKCADLFYPLQLIPRGLNPSLAVSRRDCTRTCCKICRVPNEFAGESRFFSLHN